MRRGTGSLLSVVALVLGLAIGPAPRGAHAQDQGESGLPPGPGNPIAALEARIGALEQRLADVEALEQRIAELEARLLPMTLTVNCGAGQTLQDALIQARATTAPVTITLVGTCREAVTISRNGRTTLRGAAPGAGLEAPSPDARVLTLDGGHRVILNRLTLTGGMAGLWATSGASFTATDLDISGAWTGVGLDANASGTLDRVTVAGASVGLWAGGNASFVASWATITAPSSTGVMVNGAWGQLWDSTIDGAEAGVRILGGGGLEANRSVIANSQSYGAQVTGFFRLGTGSVVRNSGFHGVAADFGGVVEVSGRVEDSAGFGVMAGGGHVSIFRDGVVQRSGGGGVGAGTGGVISLHEGLVAHNTGGGIVGHGGGHVSIWRGTVEYNTGPGVALFGASSGFIQTASLIRRNSEHGVNVNDTSVATFGAPTGELNQITDNGGYGIFCAPSPSVAMIVGGPVVGDLSGNALGAHNGCPGAAP